ncbi:MAG: tetraacyldisaccharide 4'-kinase [Prevotellaceae bacterium]|jgi:tetraacyldisaccharide 4'-kinase|nr:tetraacyldisaccharide 4'-kinase [Prevotellaceae bacterium]
MLRTLLTYLVVWPYSLVLWLRHKLYDWGFLKSVTVEIPTISIGNITVGGTGKTPHTELILRLFSQDIPMAVLSGGYKRKSRGFRYVETTDSVMDVGDEPLQIKRKFPDSVVAVDANRIAGIYQIQKDHPQVKMIVLDDAFQYRRLKPTYSILLSDYNRPYTKDCLLPFGTLRDLPSQAKRADMIIVTKTPPDCSSEERENQQKIHQPKQNQQLLLSSYTYCDPCPLFPEKTPNTIKPTGNQIIALTGIAQPKPFLDHLRQVGEWIQHLKFPDHHNFTKRDVLKINQTMSQHPRAKIFTTEKDAVRLMNTSCLSPEVMGAIYSVPVQAKICEDQTLIDVVKKNCFYYNN